MLRKYYAVGAFADVNGKLFGKKREFCQVFLCHLFADTFGEAWVNKRHATAFEACPRKRPP